MSQLTVFLAHPLFLVREGLRSILQQQSLFHVVGETAESVDVLTHIQALTPDLAIVGAELRPLNGLEVARQLSHAWPSTRVLLLGKPARDPQIREAVPSADIACVAEDATAEELLRAAAHASERHGADSRFSDHVRERKRSRTCQLSEREEAVTRLLALGYSGKEIAAQFRLSPKTVETYKSRSLEKLGINSRTGIVRYALERGWLSPGTVAEHLVDRT